MSKKRKAVFCVALAVFVAAVAFIAVYLIRRSGNTQVYDDLRDKVAVNDPVEQEEPEPAKPDPVEPAPVEPAPVEPDPVEPEEPYVSPIDFETLWDVNEDIYAWMEIYDTDVEYPIVQSATDKAYYLDHTIEGRAGYPGSIYTENVNAKDFTDFLTVIYGHNMKNGTMFGSLKKFRSLTYIQEHPTISIYTPEEELTYRIFAAVTYNSRYLPTLYDYDTQEGRQAFIDSIYGVRDMNSYVDKDVTVTADSRLVVLSTCMGSDSHRLLVVGVLEEDGGEE